jgi:uncharacterized protein YjbI with pentapeptide repeats
MQDPWSMLPKELFERIFSFLPFILQTQSSRVNKRWHIAYQSSDVLPDAKNVLSLMYHPGTRPVKMRKAIESRFSGKSDLMSKKKQPSIWDNVICIIITATLISIEFKQFSETQKSLTTEHNKKSDDTMLLSTSLKQALFMMQYAKGDPTYKATNRGYFLTWSKENTIFINFNEGNLSGENLTGSKFFGSSFVKTNLSKAILNKADFRETNCTEANFESAKLADMDFCGANLMGANLDQIEGIPLFDANTILIGAKMQLWLESRAKASGAILSLRQLAERMRDRPNDFSETLFLQACRRLLRKEIADCSDVLAQTGKKNLKNAKRAILQELYQATDGDIQTLCSKIKEITTQKWKEIITTTDAKVEKEITGAELLSRKGGFFGNDELVNSKIINDVSEAVQIITNIPSPPKASKPPNLMG